MHRLTEGPGWGSKAIKHAPIALLYEAGSLMAQHLFSAIDNIHHVCMLLSLLWFNELPSAKEKVNDIATPV